MAILPRQSTSTSSPQTPPANQSLSATIYIPVIVIIGAIIALTIGSWARRRIWPQSTQAAAATTPNTAASATETEARRPRRNRRRASQISTRSLPAYMEEAGDQELILLRRRESMPTVEETRLSMDESGSDEEGTAQHNTPLLERNYDMPFSNAINDMTQLPNERSMVSLDTEDSVSTSHGAPSMVDSPSTTHSTTHRDEDSNRESEYPPGASRGAAPSYSEAISDDAHSRLDRTLTSASDPPPSNLGRSPSLFRSLFSRDTGGHAAPLPSSVLSVSGSSVQPPDERRPSTSSSFRRPSLALNRSRATTAPLDDPRRNISAPLPHTLVRTEFTYPRSGPTQDQIKFLSSRESLGRFGVPFGEEAIAAAELPPSFAAVVGTEDGHARRPSFSSALAPTEEEPRSPVAGPSELSQLSDPLHLRPPIAVRHPNEQLPNIVTSRPTPPPSPPLPTPVKSPITPTTTIAVADATALASSPLSNATAEA